MHNRRKPATSLVGAYIELTKANVMSMVLVSTILGYYLGGNGIDSMLHLIKALIGTALVAGGAGALNHYLEKEADALMERTKNRPIPSQIISAGNALMFGIILVLVGTIILVKQINLLTGFLSLLTAFLYVLVYTPLKKVTWLNTSIGSIPGAIPPMGGWAAATGQLDSGAWILFAILYLWQHPHFYAIAWMFKDDYAKANLKMLPVIEPDGKRMIRQILWHLSLLIPISAFPYITGISGLIYLIGVVILSVLFLLSAVPMIHEKTNHNAKILLKTSVFYLPLLLILIVVDKVI